MSKVSTVVEDSHGNTEGTAGSLSTIGMKIYTLKQVLEDTSQPPPAIVSDGVLLDETMLLISGPAKAGKSFLATNLSLAIAAKKSFAGFKIPAAQKVLMLSAEGGFYPNRDRLKTMGQELLPLAGDNFHVRLDARLNLTNATDLKELGAMLTKLRPKVLVVDPLIRFHNADENEASEMSSVFKSIRQIMSDYGLSVILVHHTGKIAKAGPRGSSVINGEYDSAISLSGKGAVRLLSFDMRHVETPKDRKVRFNPDTLWFEANDVHPIAQILLSNPDQQFSLKMLVDECVKEGLYRGKSAYKAINKAVNDGFVEVKEGVYVPTN